MSSPVGGNSFTISDVLKDGTNPTSATSTPLDIDFVSGFDGDISTPIKIPNYWIFTYASANGNKSNWTQKGSTGSISVTDGFILKGPGTSQNYTFVGTPNDGNLNTTVGANEAYLVGNPFPSAISSKKFIEDNINSITGTLYFWQHASEVDPDKGHSYNGYIGGYATRNIAMGIAANAASIAGGFDILLESINATFTGSSVTDLSTNAILLIEDSDYVAFNETSRGVDVLKIKYRALTDKNIRLKINNQTIGEFTLPMSLTYNTFEITKCIERNSKITIESLDNSLLYLQGIVLQDDDGKISCAPSANGASGFTYTSPLDYIAVGQGFFINGNSDGGPVTFNNSQRENVLEGSESSFFKSNTKHKEAANKRKPLPILKLGMDYTDAQNNKLHRQIGISFKDSNSFKYDLGYDSYLFDLSATDFYWKLPEIEEKLAIVGVQNISEDLEIPLEIIVAKNDIINIGIDEENLSEENIFITDKLESISYKLTGGVASINLPIGTYKDRFFLTFKETKTLSINDELSANLTIYYNKNNKEININLNEKLLVNKVELYTILGQKINSWKFLKNESNYKTLQVNNLSKAVYIVKIKTDKGDVSKKILIH